MQGFSIKCNSGLGSSHSTDELYPHREGIIADGKGKCKGNFVGGVCMKAFYGWLKKLSFRGKGIKKKLKNIVEICGVI